MNRVLSARTRFLTGLMLIALVSCGAPPPAQPPASTATTSAPGEVRVDGVVEAGVEAGCLILHPYLLLGGDRSILVPGRWVTVRGQPRPDLATTCQQGIPLEVRDATPNGR